MKKSLIPAAIGIALLAFLVINVPVEPQEGTFTDLFRAWGNNQQEVSEEFTDKTVGKVEGDLVGEHTDDGSN